MLIKKAFTFVRHGETEHNRQQYKTDHDDVPLNETGRQQALSLAPLMGEYQSIYCSPLQRAKETKELFAPNVPHIEIEDLGECTARVWGEMTLLKSRALEMGGEDVVGFLEKVKRGVNGVLDSQANFPLIVSHGGVHWAICFWMGIENHDWLIGNCEPVHFFYDNGQWRTKLLKRNNDENSSAT